MTAEEITDKLYNYLCDKLPENTCDVIKAGSPDREVKKIAVTMLPTVDVIRAAAEWNADLLITHEPIYYQHMDIRSDTLQVQRKLDLVEKSGMTVYRFHDSTHLHVPDVIVEGFIRKWKPDGKTEFPGDFDLSRTVLSKPMTASEIAEDISKKLNMNNIRIAGKKDCKSTKISFLCGAIGDAVRNELDRNESEIVITGETSEWSISEYARDMASFGLNKSLIVLGHSNSERPGMEYFSEIIREQINGVDVRYFDCGDVY